MVRERIGKTLIHNCGHIWSTRIDKQKRCPGCFNKISRDNTFKITKKIALAIYNTIENGGTFSG